MKWFKEIVQRIYFLLFIQCLVISDIFGNSINNEIQETPAVNGSSPDCCKCDYSDLLTRFIEAIGDDELIRRFEFRGPLGPEGPIGAEGIPGRPGSQGPDGPPGPPGIRGERGRMGKRGQKGEPAEVIIHRQLQGQRTVVIKGVKGDAGKRGPRGDPGISIEGQKGEPGTGVPEYNWELRESLKGEKGERGIPGRKLNCRSCYNVKRKLLGKQQPELDEKVYVPVKGPPGRDIIGSPGTRGPKGEPGEPGRVTKNHVVVLSYEEELNRVFDEYTLGTIAYVRATETLFIQTDRAWKEIKFTERSIDPYPNRRRHEQTRPRVATS